MKKLFTYTFAIIVLSSLSSCFVFQPPQKTCPAYSLNPQEDINMELITLQDKKTKKANF
ncbi:MAG: hypothetical protein P8I02_05265 [Flavobacteriales bacterium]|nr:hypothetical protein [Flavobacteriales bacterium]